MTPAILHVADIHFGCEDRAAVDALAAVLPQIDPALVVVAGDLTYRGTRREFAAAAAWLATLDRPVVITPGNHDAPYFNLDRLFDPFDDFDRSFAARGATSHDDAAFRIATINTARGIQARLNWAHGVISSAQARAAATQLGGAPHDVLRIVVCHHPLIVPEGAPISTSTRGGPKAAELLTLAGVDLVLSGHLHRPFAQAFPFGDGLSWSVGCGTLSHRQRGAPAGFSVLTRRPGGIDVTHWHVAGASATPGETQSLPLRR